MHTQKHILFISSWYPNRLNPTHGIFNAYMAKAAALYNKVSVIHVCSDPNAKQLFEPVESNDAGIHTYVVYYKKVQHAVPGIAHWQKMRRLTAAYDLAYQALVKSQGAVDLIQLNVAMPAGIGVLHLAKKYKLPYVLNENWSGYTKEDGNYKGLLLTQATKKIVAGAKKIMPTSSYLQSAMQQHGLKGDYEVVPNVVDVNKFMPGENFNPGKIMFIHVSSLIDREKNVGGILRAFKQALSAVPNIELCVVGEGDNKIELQALAKQLGIDAKVEFKGRVVGEELIRLLQQSKALVMFSHYETFCLVNIEAFACGKPVITSNAGAIPGYMNNNLGIMVEKNKEAALSDAMIKMANNYAQFDPQYIRNFAMQFSYESVGKQLDRIYLQSINQSA